MNKIHKTLKIKYGLSSHLRHYRFFHPVVKLHRPKTFKTEEAAKEWAAKNGLKPGQYTLKSVKKNKRFGVILNQEIKKVVTEKAS